MDTNKTKATILQTKQHFNIPDGLRGVAALAVVTFHFMEWVFTAELFGTEAPGYRTPF